jgi:hypothetical protein
MPATCFNVNAISSTGALYMVFPPQTGLHLGKPLRGKG